MPTAPNTHTTPMPRRTAMKIGAAALAASLTVPARACTADATTLPTLALASPAAGVEGPDAVLLDLCAEFHRIHGIVTGDDRRKYSDEAFHALMGERWDTSDAIADIPARTLAGHLAKARVVIALIEEHHPGQIADGDLFFAYAVLHDLAGSAAA